MNLFFQIVAFAKYGCKARHRKGFGVHSPFVFRLLNRVFYENENYYCYQKIERNRKKLLSNRTKIHLTDLGTGSPRTRTIADIARKTVKQCKFAQLLFRLANFNHSKTILELGTSLGLTTMYLAATGAKSTVTTIEGDPTLCQMAAKTFAENGYKNINVVCGNIDEHLPELLKKTDKIDFVFFDANHTKEATLRYFYACLPKIHKNTIFAFDDIHSSCGMQQAWNEIARNSAVTLAIDIFQMGIVWFNSDLTKQNYIVAF